MNFKKMLTVAAALVVMAGASSATVSENNASFFTSSVVSVSAAARATSIQQEMNYYKQGEYWNHGIIETSSKQPCDHSKDRTRYCNYVNGDHWQCEGFAEKIAYDIYGTYPHGNSNQKPWKSEAGKSGYTKVKRGDVIRDYNAPHSFMIIKVNGNTLTVGECNEGNKQCKINWKRTITKSDLNKNGIEIYYAPYEARYSSSDIVSTEKTPALGTVWVEGDTYIFTTNVQMYSDKTGKTKAGTIPKGGSKVIRRFFTANNGKDTIGMIDASHFVLVRKNNVLGVRAFVITNDKTGVNLRNAPTTDKNKSKVLVVVPYGKKLQVTACSNDGKWAKTTYNGKTGWVNLGICKG